MLSRFAHWEKYLLGAIALIVALLIVLYVLPYQKLLAAKLKDADRGLLANQLVGGGASLTGNELRQVIHALQNSERLPPWDKVDSTGGYEFQFFQGSNLLATVKAAQGVFWIRKTAYIDRSSNLDPLFDRVRKSKSPTAAE